MRSPLQRLLTIFFPRKREAAITDEVRTVLEGSGPVEQALEKVEPRLSPDTIKSIVKCQLSKPDPQLGLRFFTWTLNHVRLRPWECYNSVLGVILRENGAELDRYWDTLEEIRKSEAEVSCRAFQMLVEGYSSLGKHEKAVETFGRMKDFDCSPNVHTYNKLLLVVLQKKLFLLALAVYSKMQTSNCLPNCGTYVTLIDGFRRGGQINTVLKLFDEMLKSRVSANVFVYSSVIMALCQANDISNALKVLDAMRENGCRPSLVTWNAMLSGSCKGGKIDEALVLLQVFIKEGYAPGLKGYSSVIDGLFRRSRYNEAVKWYKKLLKVSEPDVVLYGIMIRGYAEAHRFDDACKILHEMTDRGIRPNAYCYNALIKGYCQAGLLNEAHSLKVEISQSDNSSANAHTYTILICGLCKNGLVTHAEYIFKEMEEKGCIPAVATFNTLMHGLCNFEKFEEARKLFSKMEIGKNPSVFLLLSQGSNMAAPNLDPISLKVMLEQYCIAGLYIKAYKLLMKLSTVPDISTYNTLINGFCKVGNISAASKLFRELQVRGLTPDSVTYGTLIDGFFRANDEEAALKVLDMMVKNGCSPTDSAYKCAMTWSCRKKKVFFAFTLWLNYLRGNDFPLQDQHELLNLAAESFAKGEVGNAIRAIIELDLARDIGFYNIVLVGMCQAGKIKDSFEIFSILKDFNISVSPASCTFFILAATEAGNLDLAMQVFLYTIEKGFQLKKRVCNELFGALLHSQSTKHHAFDLIDRMKPMYNLHHQLYRSTKDLLFRVA